MKISKLFIIGIVTVVLIAAITGCGTSRNTPSSTPSPTTDKNTVIMQDYKFQPAEITINKGENVTWINQDSAAHDVIGDSFKSDLFNKGESFTQTFNETGTFDYYCSVHSGMTGKVIVK